MHGARITTRRGFAERACRFSLTASVTCATASSSACPTAVAMDAGSPIMGGSTAEGIEEDREDRVDDHDGEEARHHRRRRRPAHTLGAAAGGETALARDEGDAQPEYRSWASIGPRREPTAGMSARADMPAASFGIASKLEARASI